MKRHATGRRPGRRDRRRRGDLDQPRTASGADPASPRLLLARAQREATGGVPDPVPTAQIERLSRSLPAELAPTVAAGSLIPIGFRVDGVELRFFSTITTVGTPMDVTLQELRIEQFHQAGEAAGAWSGRGEL